MIFIIIFLANFILNGANSELQVSPRRIQTEHGDSILFYCEWEGEGAPEGIHWLDPYDNVIGGNGDGSSIYVEMITDMTLLLTINEVKLDDDGIYTCEAGDSILTARLAVSRPLEFHSVPPEQSIVFGSRSVIICNVTGDPDMEIYWKRGSEILQSGDGYSIQSTGLLIDSVEQHDSGTYMCKALVKSTGVTDSRSIEVTVITPPTIVFKPRNTNGTVGNILQLDCTAMSDPSPTYTWYRNGQIIAQSNQYSISDIGQLTISDLTKQHQGTYTCEASNSAGPDYTQSASADVYVYVPPTVSHITDIAVDQGQSVQVECSAQGDPEPVLQWSFGSKILIDGPQPEDDRIEVVPRVNVLLLAITNSLPTDRGDYMCIATNRAGSGQALVNIDVYFAPYISRQSPTEVSSWVGNTVNLTCIFEGNPTPTITWYYQGRKLNNDNRYTIIQLENTNYLEVIPTLDSFGQYECTADNRYGEAPSHFIELIQAVAPSKPTQTEAVALSPVKALITWMEPVDNGGLEITGYLIRYARSATLAQELEFLPTEPAEVSGLYPNTEYVFSVAARNAIGYSPFSNNVVLLMPQEREPYRPRITSPGMSINPDSYTLTWDKPDNGGLPLGEYRIMYRRIFLHKNSSALSGYEDWVRETAPSTVTEYDLRNLHADSLYEVEIVATNRLGSSERNKIRFHTARNIEPPIGSENQIPSSKQTIHKTLSTLEIVGMVVAIFLILLIAIDLSCFVLNNCGLLMFICVTFCDKQEHKEYSIANQEMHETTYRKEDLREVEEMRHPDQIHVRIQDMEEDGRPSRYNKIPRERLSEYETAA